MDAQIQQSVDERLTKFSDLIEAGFDSTFEPERQFRLREAENTARNLIGFADGLMVCGVMRLAEYNAIVKPCYAFLRRLHDVTEYATRNGETVAVSIRKLH